MRHFGKASIILVIIALIVGVFYYTNYEKNKVLHISIDEIEDVVDNHEFTLVYFGKETEDLTKTLKLFQKDYLLKAYYATSEVEDIKTYISTYINSLDIKDNDVYAVYVEGDFEGVIATKDGEEFVAQLRKYLYGEIPESERKFKVVSTADEYLKKVNSNKYTVAVFGATSCSFCTLYLPVINEIAGEYDLDIYYFDEDKFDPVEYKEIMNLDYEIPARCTTTGASTTMKAGFPKPMTLITKKGEFVDCIRGYVVKEDVVLTLQKYDIIKEK